MKKINFTIIFIILIFFNIINIKAQTNLLTEGFEDAFPPTGWTIINLGDQTAGETWMQTSTYHHGGSYCAFSQDGETGYAMEEWLITPAITVPADNYIVITLWEMLQWAEYSDGPEYVMVSATGTAPENFIDTVYTNPGSTPTAWTEVLLNSLPDYAGETIYIAFVHTSPGGYANAWVLDDISVDAYETGNIDIGMYSIDNPKQYCIAGNEIYPIATVKNFGSSDITDDFQITCEIKNASEVLVYSSFVTYTDEITVGSTNQITFGDIWAPAETGTYNVTIYTSLTGDENIANDTLTSEVEVVEHFGTGGPDAMGYQWIDSEVAGGPAYNWIEISGTGTSAVMYGVDQFYGDYNFSEPIDFGFNFPFYGIDRSYFYVDINGEILLADNTWQEDFPNPGWGTDGNTFNYVFPVPGFTSMPALVSVFWDNLHADEGTGDIYIQTFGAEPDRYCVVEWNNLRYSSGSVEDTSLCFEVVFYENGDMIFQYKDVVLGQSNHDNGISSTIGIQNDTYDIGLCYLHENYDESTAEPIGNLIQNETAIKFYTDEDISSPIFTYNGKGNTFDNTPEIKTQILDMSGIQFDTLYYNIGSGWVPITHSNFEEPDSFTYQLPVIPNSTTVNYYFAATDNATANNRGTYPSNAPSEYMSFEILPTSNDVNVLLAYSGNQDYDKLEYNVYTQIFDSKGIVYDVYDWEEYNEYKFTDSYNIIFMYGNSMGSGEEEDTLSVALIDFLDSGTEENPKNIFTASDGIAWSSYGLPNSSPFGKFFTAYIRGGYIPQENPPYFGGTDGIGGPDIYDYSYGSIIGMDNSPVGTLDLEIQVYSNSPDNVVNGDCPPWYADEVTNPDISSWGSFLFEDGPFSGDAFSKGNGCGIWLDNLIYKSFLISFDISQFTNNADINTMIQEALDWFGYSSGIESKLNSDEDVTVYPNPNNGIFNFSLTNKDINVELINSQGQIIYEKKSVLNNRIDVKGTNAGIYFLRITTDKETKVTKVIIQ